LGAHGAACITTHGSLGGGDGSSALLSLGSARNDGSRSSPLLLLSLCGGDLSVLQRSWRSVLLLQ
jgi:hypothetical protein